MFETQFTMDFGVKYPIIQGGMMWVSRKELVSAVSNAGALGILTALTFETPDALANEIEETRKLTDKPFGVNLTFLPTLKPIDYDAYVDVVVQTGIKVVETAGRNPEKYMGKLKGAGVKVIHKCTSVRHAKKAQEIGCDYVSIDGFECAGHPGEDDVTSLILVPRASDELKIPVIASGGFGDGRGLVAALSLGAVAVNMGTRFMMTKEAPIHNKVKEVLVAAKETDTILIERSLRNTMRAWRNELTMKIAEMEKEGVTLNELAPLLSGKRSFENIMKGKPEQALVACGEVIGLINDVPTVGEVVEKIMEQAKSTIKKNYSFIKD